MFSAVPWCSSRCSASHETTKHVGRRSGEPSTTPITPLTWQARPVQECSPLLTRTWRNQRILAAATNLQAAAAAYDDETDAVLLQADTAIGAAAAAAGLGPAGSESGQAGSEEAAQADWGCILGALALDDRQLHYLLLLRERHLDRLQSLAAARQALSLQVRADLAIQRMSTSCREVFCLCSRCSLSAC